MRVFFFFIAISAILIGLGFHPSDYHDKPKCTDSHYVGAVPSSTSPSSSKANQSIHEPNRPKTDQQITNEIACSGLVAQWVAADTTERMFWFSIAGMALILVTLLETQAAGKLITQQNVNAVKATKAEFQPYISFEETAEIGHSFLRDEGLEPILVHENNWIEIPFVVRFKNIGKTPATSILCHFEGHYLGSINNGEAYMFESKLQRGPSYLFGERGGKINCLFKATNDGKEPAMPQAGTVQMVGIKGTAVSLFCKLYFRDSFCEKDTDWRAVEATYSLHENRNALELMSFRELNPATEDTSPINKYNKQ